MNTVKTEFYLYLSILIFPLAPFFAFASVEDIESLISVLGHSFLLPITIIYFGMTYAFSVCLYKVLKLDPLSHNSIPERIKSTSEPMLRLIFMFSLIVVIGLQLTTPKLKAIEIYDYAWAAALSFGQILINHIIAVFIKKY